MILLISIDWLSNILLVFFDWYSSVCLFVSFDWSSPICLFASFDLSSLVGESFSSEDLLFIGISILIVDLPWVELFELNSDCSSVFFSIKLSVDFLSFILIDFSSFDSYVASLDDTPVVGFPFELSSISFSVNLFFDIFSIDVSVRAVDFFGFFFICFIF